MKKFLLASFLFSSLSAEAKDLKKIVIPTLYYSALQYGDWKTTRDAIKRGGIESNFTVSAVGITPAKIVGVIALSTADLLLQGNKKNKAALWTYRIAISGIYTAVIINNTRVAR